MKKPLAYWAIVSILCLFTVADAAAAQSGSGRCRRNDKVWISDLDMAPDPVVQGQRIRMWKVKLNFDGSRDCEMEIEIRDRENRVVAREDSVRIHRGLNEVNIRPDEKYEFSRGEHCLRVTVNLEGTRTDMDAKRQFCARQKPAWSMK